MWAIEWRVTRGPIGRRSDSHLTNLVVKDETIEFTLKLSSDVLMEDFLLAQRPDNWAQRFQLVVTASNGQSSRPIVATRRNHLVLSYTFNYIGKKTLRFTGSARRRSRRGTARGGQPNDPPLFDPVNLYLELEVVNRYDFVREFRAATEDIEVRPASEILPTAQAPSPTVRRRAAHAQAETRRQQHEEAQARRRRREEEGRRRDSMPPGLFRFNFKSPEEIQAMTVRQFNEYLEQLQNKIDITPVLDLTTRRQRLPEPIEVNYLLQRIEVDYLPRVERDPVDRNGIVVFDRPVPTRYRIHPGYVDEVRQQVRRQTSKYYSRDDWIVARVERGGPKALFRGEDLLRHQIITDFINTLDVILLLSDILVPLWGLTRSVGGRGLLVAARRLATQGVREGVTSVGRLGRRVAPKVTDDGVSLGARAVRDRLSARTPIQEPPPPGLGSRQILLDPPVNLAARDIPTPTSSGPLLLRGRGINNVRFREALNQAIQNLRDRGILPLHPRLHGVYGTRLHSELSSILRNQGIHLPAGFRVTSETTFRNMRSLGIPQPTLNQRVLDFLESSELPPKARAGVRRNYRENKDAIIGEIRPDIIVEDGLGNVTIVDLTSKQTFDHLAKTQLYQAVIKRGASSSVGIAETYWRPFF